MTTKTTTSAASSASVANDADTTGPGRETGGRVEIPSISLVRVRFRKGSWRSALEDLWRLGTDRARTDPGTGTRYRGTWAVSRKTGSVPGSGTGLRAVRTV